MYIIALYVCIQRQNNQAKIIRGKEKKILQLHLKNRK